MSNTPTLEPRPHQMPAGLTASLTYHVLARDQYACFRCGTNAMDTKLLLCSRKTGTAASTAPGNLMLCRSCIPCIYMDTHRRRSIRLGYLIPAGNFHPSAVPVLHHRNGWVLLTSDGKWAKADEYAVKDWEARWGA